MGNKMMTFEEYLKSNYPVCDLHPKNEEHYHWILNEYRTVIDLANLYASEVRREAIESAEKIAH